MCVYILPFPCQILWVGVLLVLFDFLKKIYSNAKRAARSSVSSRHVLRLIGANRQSLTFWVIQWQKIWSQVVWIG